MPATLQRYLKVAQAGSSRPRLMRVAATQTIYKGDLLAIDSNGRVTQAVAAGNNVGASTATTVMLIADQNSLSQAVDTLIQVLTVNEDTTLTMLVMNSDTAPTVPSPLTWQGKFYEVRRCTASPYPYVVDYSQTTNTKVEVVDIDPNTSSDTYPALIVRPIVGAWAK